MSWDETLQNLGAVLSAMKFFRRSPMSSELPETQIRRELRQRHEAEIRQLRADRIEELRGRRKAIAKLVEGGMTIRKAVKHLDSQNAKNQAPDGA